MLPLHLIVSVSSRSYILSYSPMTRPTTPPSYIVSVSSRSYILSYIYPNKEQKILLAKFPSPLGVIFSLIFIERSGTMGSRTSFRLLSELYSLLLKQVGIYGNIKESFRLLSELYSLLFSWNIKDFK